MKLNNKDIENKLFLETSKITPNMLEVLKEIDVEREEEKEIKFNLHIIKYAISFVSILLIFITGVVLYNYEIETVTIDINPSIELSINTFGIVTKINYNNQDAEDVFKNVKLKNKRIDDAVALCYEKLYDKGYFNTEEQNIIIISGYCHNHEFKDEKLNELIDVIRDKNEKHNVDCNIKKNPVKEEDKHKADKYDISYGKLKMIEMILEINPDINFEDLINYDLRDLKKLFFEIDDNGKDDFGNGFGDPNRPNGGPDKWHDVIGYREGLIKIILKLDSNINAHELEFYQMKELEDLYFRIRKENNEISDFDNSIFGYYTRDQFINLLLTLSNQLVIEDLQEKNTLELIDIYINLKCQMNNQHDKKGLIK